MFSASGSERKLNAGGYHFKDTLGIGTNISDVLSHLFYNHPPVCRHRHTKRIICTPPQCGCCCRDAFPASRCGHARAQFAAFRPTDSHPAAPGNASQSKRQQNSRPESIRYIKRANTHSWWWLEMDSDGVEMCGAG